MFADRFYAIIQKSVFMAEICRSLCFAEHCGLRRALRAEWMRQQGWEYVTFIERIQGSAGEEGADRLPCGGGF